MRVILLYLFALPLWPQTAITSLTAFWQPGTPDRIMWDYKGSAHGMYAGLGYQTPGTVFGGGFSRAPGAQTPVNSGSMAVPASLVATGANSFCYAVWTQLSSNLSDPIMGQWGDNTSTTRSWMLFADSPGYPHVTLEYAMNNNGTFSVGSVSDAAVTLSTNQLVLMWMAYNSSTGQVSVAANGDSWTTATPAHPFVTPTGPLDLSQITGVYFPSGSPVIGRAMFWNGYIPANAERAAIYNGGAGQPQSYFGLSFSVPAQPLTVTQINFDFADDNTLSSGGYAQGLYWLRPYPLYQWLPALAANLGYKYVWFRSLDHASLTPDAISMGFSNSPATLPSSWTTPLGITQLEAAAGGAWSQSQNPWAEFNPDTGKIHLYWNALHSQGGSTYSYIEQTWVWTTADLSTWTYGGLAFPALGVLNGCAVNYTGYATPHWISPHNWGAQTLLNDSTSKCDAGRYGQWSSTDGLNWTLAGGSTFSNVQFPYLNQEGQTTGPIAARGQLAYSSNYAGKYYISGQDEIAYPHWQLFQHVYSSDPNGGWLQDVRAYEENGTVWLYAKSGFKQPSSTILYQGVIAPGTVTPMSTESAAGGSAALAPGALASSFGTDLATGAATAQTPAWPGSLNGTTVTIADSTGVATPAPVYYVSAGQVNYQIPDSVAVGPARVTVTSGDGTASTGSVTVSAVAPAIFTLNAANLGAMVGVCVAADGTQTVENVYQVVGGAVVAAPLSLSACAETVLTIYATGLGSAAAPDVQVSINGVPATVLYAGRQGTYAGLDQINVMAPSTLAGSGSVPLVVSAAGNAANQVYVTIQ